MAKKVTTKKEAEKKTPAKSAKAKPAKEVKKAVVKPKAKPTAKPAVKAVAKPAAKPAAKAAAKPAVKAAAKPAVKKPVVKKVIIKKDTVKKEVMEKKAKKVETAAPVKTEAPKKAPAVKGYGKKDLEHFRKVILEKRDEILEQLQNLKEQMMDPTTGEYINENSPYSLHMAEQGTDAMEREKTFLYAQRENKFLSYLEDALKRIDLGTYGLCVECIDEPQHLCPTCPLIPKARLEAVPHSQLCVQMKQKQEKR